MFFYVQGPNKHELMPVERIFDRRVVNKTEAVKASKTIHPRQIHGATQEQTAQKYSPSFSAGNAYQAIDKLPEDDRVLFADQIMTTPVVSLTAAMTLNQTLKIFQSKRFRHLPVISSTGKVTGMVSDRDVLQYMAGLHGHMQKTSAMHKTSDKVEQLMQSPVITAGLKTDIRYIARLFVEQHIGAVPVVSDGELKGMITRSDILRAVMSHYELELWI